MSPNMMDHDSTVNGAEAACTDKLEAFMTEIKEPISYIKQTLENMGKTQAKNTAVLTGAQSSGIVNIYPNRESLNKSIIKEFNNKDSKGPVCIQGVSLGSYFLDDGFMYEHFKAFLRNRQSDSGGSSCEDEDNEPFIKVLIIDPISKALFDRTYYEVGSESCQSAENYKVSATYEETNIAFKKARELMNEFSKLEVRCYTQSPTCFVLLIGEYAFVENYTYLRRGLVCPSIQIEKDGNKQYDLYKMHFDNLWKTATRVKEYNPPPINPKSFDKIKISDRY